MFKGKILLITGGTGSFGNAVVKHFLNTDIKEIRVFSRDEKKQDDMRREYKNDNLKFYIGDIRDYNSIYQATKDVDYIFHAAALKQVPSCEFYPSQAVKTNINGCENLVNAALQNQVRKVIALSTDKAVYPINAMGISKAMMEKIVTASSRLSDKTIFCCTRYGNVMATRGSVIPLFVQQAKENMPLTITDPQMTRFMMSLEESVELVLFTFKNAKAGDIFVQKAPAATIYDLALAIKDIFKSKSELKIIGTRHGEKLFETLLSREEMVRAEDLVNYFRIPADTRNLNYDKYFFKGEEKMSYQEDYTSHNTKRLNIGELKTLLLKLEFIQHELR